MPSFVTFMIILAFTIVLFIGYSVLLTYYWISWRSIPEFVPPSKSPTTRISVIIPARNEEENISKLLNSIKEQTYPAGLFETIVVNDHSTDATASIVRGFPWVKLLNLEGAEENSQKKKAIETGITNCDR